MLETPVILLTYNRPDRTAQVLDVLRQVKPRTLYVVSDGPRRPQDAPKVSAVRKLMEDVGWPCEVIRDYSDRNLACALRVASGIDNAFRRFEEAIVLEDDTVPDLSFFPYCVEVLERYRHDPRVMQISGTLMYTGKVVSPYSYGFTQIVTTWGWATWRRAWELYDTSYFSTPFYRFIEENKKVGNAVRKLMGAPGKLQRLLTDRTGWAEADRDPAFRDRVRACGKYQFFGMMVAAQKRGWGWGYGWSLAVLRQNGLVATPSRNLVRNIGFGMDATHALAERNAFANRPAEPMPLPLVHPPEVALDPALQSACAQCLDWAFHLSAQAPPERVEVTGPTPARK